MKRILQVFFNSSIIQFFNYLLALNGGPTGIYRFFYVLVYENDVLNRIFPKVHSITLHTDEDIESNPIESGKHIKKY
jgi:hypothetical protein